MVGEYLKLGLEGLAQKYPNTLESARGRGLMCAIDLPNGPARDRLQQLMYEENVIVLSCGDHSIRFRPHLNVTIEEIQMALDKMELCIAKM